MFLMSSVPYYISPGNLVNHKEIGGTNVNKINIIKLHAKKLKFY